MVFTLHKKLFKAMTKELNQCYLTGFLMFSLLIAKKAFIYK